MCCHLKLRPLWIWEGGSLMSMPQPTVVNSQAPEGGSWCLFPIEVPKMWSFQACGYPEENIRVHMVLGMVRAHRINDIRRQLATWQGGPLWLHPGPRLSRENHTGQASEDGGRAHLLKKELGSRAFPQLAPYSLSEMFQYLLQFELGPEFSEGETLATMWLVSVLLSLPVRQL